MCGLDIHLPLLVVHPCKGPRHSSVLHVQHTAVGSVLSCKQSHGVIPFTVRYVDIQLAGIGDIEHGLMLFRIPICCLCVPDGRRLVEAIHVSSRYRIAQGPMEAFLKVASHCNETIAQTENGLLELMQLFDILILHNTPFLLKREQLRYFDVTHRLAAVVLQDFCTVGNHAVFIAIAGINPSLQVLGSIEPLEAFDRHICPRLLQNTPNALNRRHRNGQSNPCFLGCLHRRDGAPNDHKLGRGSAQCIRHLLPVVWLRKGFQTLCVSH
mmetsp:Transcript_7270/g.13858  ORF Transcript_7270/g.13858 Transcript_7270/m.13858 type:complete len:268 (+) Transcript_7270:2263-3066(+)